MKVLASGYVDLAIEAPAAAAASAPSSGLRAEVQQILPYNLCPKLSISPSHSFFKNAISFYFFSAAVWRAGQGAGCGCREEDNGYFPLEDP